MIGIKIDIGTDTLLGMKQHKKLNYTKRYVIGPYRLSLTHNERFASLLLPSY